MSTTRRRRRLIEEANEAHIDAGDENDISELAGATATTTPSIESRYAQHMRGADHVCNLCDKAFSRSEHLSRHLDSHSSKKRWPCAFCRKKFSRRDVLNRHFAKCKRAIEGTYTQVQRVNRACENCSKRKVKCSGSQPCAECVKGSTECFYPLSRASSWFPAPISSPANDQATPANNGVANSLTTSPPSSPHTGNQIMQPAQDDLQTSNTEEGNSTRRQDADAQAAQSVDNAGATFISRQTPLTGSAPLFHGQFQPDPSADMLQSEAFWPFGPGVVSLDWLYFDFPPAINGADPIIPIANAPTGADNDLRVPTITSQDCLNHTTDNEMPSGLDVARIDPLRHHHGAILHFLVTERNIPLQQLQWLSPENIGLFIKAYFIHFHKHCPIIHLPHWSVATCGTPMVFSMILLAALYIPNTRVGVQDSRNYCSMAYDFAMRSNQEPNTLHLETLQSIFLLAILDRILANGSKKQPQINFQAIVALARDNGFFEDRTFDDDPTSTTAWEQWSIQESRRRTTFVLYCFDAITSVLLDERPSIAIYEMHITMPSPEDLFTVARREEWATLYREVGNQNAVSYSVLLSLLLSDSSETNNIPCTIMGCFVLVHGILLHAWETGKHYANRTIGPSDLFEAFKRKRYEATQHALKEWHRGWQAALRSPYCSVANSAGLYRERSLVYWYLAGILSFPTPARSSTTSSSRGNAPQEEVSLKLWMHRLISRLEKGQLDSSLVSFEAAQQFVESVVSEEAHGVPISSLLFPENVN